MSQKPLYKRVLLKLSGEALMGRDVKGLIQPFSHRWLMKLLLLVS